MRKRLAVCFLLVFAFQSAGFAETAPVPESRFKNAQRKTAGVMQHTAQWALDVTYTIMRKLDLAG